MANNFFKIDRGLSVTPQSTTPTNPQNGDIYYDDTLNVFRRYEAGAWKTFSAGGGAKSYAIENDSTADDALGSNWGTFDDSSYPPVDGSGGTVTATLARTTSSPLQGNGSMLFTPGGQYDGARFQFTIDRADFARMMKIEFDYEFDAGSYTSYTDGDVKLAVVCASNSLFTTDLQVIQPVGHTIMKVSAPATHVATFQSHASNLYYRVCAVQTTASTGYTLKIDNFKVGPQSVAYGCPVTSVESYTPLLNSTSNVSFNTGYWTRVGDKLRVEGRIKWSGSGTGTLTLGLPSGKTIDTSKHSYTATQTQVGTANWFDAGVGWNDMTVVYDSTTSVRFAVYNGGGNFSQTSTANNDEISYQFEVPILGWSSNTVVSDSADTRVVSFRGTNGSTQSLTANTTRIAVTAVAGGDTHNAWDGDEYVVPVPGDYVLILKAGDNSGTTVGFDVYVDGSNYGRIHNSYATSAGENGSGLVFIPGLRAGQRVDARCNSSITCAPASISVFKLSGSSQIAASGSVSARYMVNGSTSNTVLNNNAEEIIDFNLKDWDSHGAVTTGASWKFTAPVSGEYEVKTMSGVNSGSWSAGEFFQLLLYKDGVANQGLAVDFKEAANTQDTFLTGSGSVKLLAGQYIYIGAYQNTGFNVNFSTNTVLHWVSIRRVGNY